MPTQRQNYKWRPNDESSTTRMRYDLEASHWYRSFKNAEREHKPSSISADLGVIGLFLSLISSLIVLIILSLVQFIKWLRS